MILIICDAFKPNSLSTLTHRKMSTNLAIDSSSGDSSDRETKKKKLITRCLDKMECINWTTVGFKETPNISEKWREPPKSTIVLFDKLGQGAFGSVWVSRGNPPIHVRIFKLMQYVSLPFTESFAHRYERSQR